MNVVSLVAAERLRLADELDTLSPTDWEHETLCEGWNARVVAAHLNAPWAAKPSMLVSTFVKARGRIPTTLDQLSLSLGRRLDPASSIAGLRAHASHHFPWPWPTEAPLTDIVIHGADILTPLGRAVDVAPDALAAMLTWLSTGAMRAFLPPSRLRGLALHATDIDLRLGDGELIEGAALAVAGALLGRPVYLPRLDGPGVDVLAERLG